MKKGINILIILGVLISSIGIIFGMKTKFFDNTINVDTKQNSITYTGNKKLNIKENGTGTINVNLNIDNEGLYLIDFNLPEQIELYENKELTKRIYNLYKLYSNKTKDKIKVYYKNTGNKYNQMAELNIKKENIKSTIINKAQEKESIWADEIRNTIEQIEFKYDTNPICNNCYDLSNSITKVYGLLENNKLTIVSDYVIYLPEDSSYMFDNFKKLKQIKLDNINSSKVENMSYMFSNNNIENLDLSTLTTENVVDMEGMFRNDENLKTLDISNFTFEQNLKYNYIFKNMNADAKIYVKSSVEQAWVFGLNIYIRPGTWNTNNIIIK